MGYAYSTTREEMRYLEDGDLFFISGEEHTADGDSHLSEDASCDEYIVYDEAGNSFFESDFPDFSKDVWKALDVLNISWEVEDIEAAIERAGYPVTDASVNAVARLINSNKGIREVIIEHINDYLLNVAEEALPSSE